MIKKLNLSYEEFVLEQSNLHLGELNWFWSEFKTIRISRLHLAGSGRGICQCSTKTAIERSSNPSRFHAIFLISSLLDQTMHCHFYSEYSDFENM